MVISVCFLILQKNGLKFSQKEQKESPVFICSMFWKLTTKYNKGPMCRGLWDCQCLGDQSKIFRRNRTIGSDAKDLRAGLFEAAGMHEVLI